MDHAARILEPRQQGMGVVFQIQVGVLLALDHVAGKRGAEKAGQAEIVAAPAALVVERGLVGGHQPAALFDEGLQLRALRVGQVGDIRQGQDLELLQALGSSWLSGTISKGMRASTSAW